ncbi:MAG: glycosyltransferase family 39 protein [Patescibacteria group bacterium]
MSIVLVKVRQYAIRHTSSIFLAGVVILGGVLRAIHLGTEPFWGDEALSFDIATNFSSAAALIDYLKLVEVHPPLYYLLLQWWTVFGEGEFIARLPSFIAGLGVVLATYGVTHSFFKSRTAAIVAALITALLPSQIEFSQEARPYALFTLIGLITLWCYSRYRRSGNRYFLVGYGAAMLAGLYVHYSFLFFAASLAVVWLFDAAYPESSIEKRRNWFLAWFYTHVAIALGFMPWLSTVFYKLFLGEYELWGVARSIGNGVRSVSFPSVVSDQLLWLNDFTKVAPVVTFAVFFWKLVFLLCLAYTVRNLWRRGELPESRGAVLLLAVAVLSLTGFLFSPQSISYTPKLQEHILINSVLFAMLIGYALSLMAVKLRLLCLALFIISTVPFTVQVVGNDEVWDTHHRLRIVANFINESFQPGDVVITESAFLRTDINHYLRTDIETHSILPIGYFGNDLGQSRQTLGLVENESQFRIFRPTNAAVVGQLEQVLEREQAKRVWLVFFIDPSTLTVWLEANGWRASFLSPSSSLLPVNMYTKRTQL